MADTTQKKQPQRGRIAHRKFALPAALRTLWERFLHAFWFVYPDVSLTFHAAPSACLLALAAAAKPSTQRLHLSNVFRQGRRYELQPDRDGFRMLTTAKVIWSHRRRTGSSAILQGTFNIIDEQATQLHLRSRMRGYTLLTMFLLPIYVTSIVAFMPWPRLGIIILLGALYGLAWTANRYNAALETHEMIYFITKALEDFVPKISGELGGGEAVIYNRDFAEAWEKSYGQQPRDE